MDIKKHLGQRIKEIRKSKKYTQDKLAEKIGIDTVSLSNIERGKFFPNPENIEKLAMALDVEVKDLFDFQHFQNKSFLLQQIIDYIDNAEDKEIEFLYKTITNLSQFKNK